MQKIFAISWLTWKAAIRFRLFLVVSALLLATVVGLPILIKDDGTARGFAQILLTYTLSTITGLLGLSTLWLACGTLARDIEECQIQMVAVKPIARWQIWVGKWLGLVTLNAVLLALSGGSVFALLQWRATRLPEAEQRILRNEVLVARGSAREPSRLADIETETDHRLQERLKSYRGGQVNEAEVRAQLRQQVIAELQVVPAGYIRPWDLNLGPIKDKLVNQPLFLRVKFNAAAKSESGTFIARWQVGDPHGRYWQSEPLSLAPDTFHEIEIPPNMVDVNGRLTVLFNNENNTSLLFPLEDGFEVLYRESSFLANFIRGLGIIFCWMTLLAALGLAAASFLTFPVAAFCALTALGITMCSGTISGAIADNSILSYNAETNQMRHSPADFVVLPLFRALLAVINLAKDFSPIDALSSGRNITWMVFLAAFVRIVLVLGGLLAALGVYLFHRRELATAQGTQ